MNNGRPLEAAAGFDEWRKSIIKGRAYVVDALVRRRTAEKALFLRPESGVVAAPRNELPPQSDEEIRSTDTQNVFTRATAQGIVEQAPYAAQKAQLRRRDDAPARELSLSEILPAEGGERDVVTKYSDGTAVKRRYLQSLLQLRKSVSSLTD